MSNNNWSKVEFLEDLELFVRVKYIGSAIEFEVKELTMYDDGNGSPWKFLKHKGESDQEITTNPDDEVENLIKGEIKWDGCSHIYFPDYIHGCSRQDLTRIGKVFNYLFDVASEMMPDNNDLLE